MAPQKRMPRVARHSPYLIPVYLESSRSKIRSNYLSIQILASQHSFRSCETQLRATCVMNCSGTNTCQEINLVLD